MSAFEEGADRGLEFGGIGVVYEVKVSAQWITAVFQVCACRSTAHDGQEANPVNALGVASPRELDARV